MDPARLGRPVVAAGGLALLCFAASCAADAPAAPSAPTVQICDVSGASGRIIAVAASRLQSYVSRGDYPVAYRVNRNAPVWADSLTFRRIGDALAAVRAGRLARGEAQTARCRITISVDAGVYYGAAADSVEGLLEKFPLIVDVPDVSLQGALVLPTNSEGIPVAGDASSGSAPGGVGTTLAPMEPLPIRGGTTSQNGASIPILIANGHPGGSTGSGLWVSGFVFQSGHPAQDTLGGGGQGVSSMRVDGLRIQGNRFDGGFSESIDLRASSATIDHNLLSGTAGTCDVCLSGPGDFVVTKNRLTAGAIPGILIVPTLQLPIWPGVEQFALPESATVTARVSNNEISDHTRLPVGTAIRVGALGIGAPNVIGLAQVTVDGNTLLNNTFGIIADAAFPVDNTARHGDIQLTLDSSQTARTCQAELFVSFSRHTTGLGLTHQPYLLNSTFSLTLHPLMTAAEFWYSNPDGFGNTLIVNGQPVPNAVLVPYVADKTC